MLTGNTKFMEDYLSLYITVGCVFSDKHFWPIFPIVKHRTYLHLFYPLSFILSLFLFIQLLAATSNKDIFMLMFMFMSLLVREINIKACKLEVSTHKLSA